MLLIVIDTGKTIPSRRVVIPKLFDFMLCMSTQKYSYFLISIYSPSNKEIFQSKNVIFGALKHENLIYNRQFSP